jgi:predicted metal-dependent hydrolase
MKTQEEIKKDLTNLVKEYTLLINRPLVRLEVGYDQKRQRGWVEIIQQEM